MVCDTSAPKEVSIQPNCDSSLKLYMRYVPDMINLEVRSSPNMIILKTRSDVKVTVTQNWYATLGHPKKHPHTKFGIPTSKNIEVMPILETRSEAKVTVTRKRNRTIRHSKTHFHSKFG